MIRRAWHLFRFTPPLWTLWRPIEWKGDAAGLVRLRIETVYAYRVVDLRTIITVSSVT